MRGRRQRAPRNQKTLAGAAPLTRPPSFFSRSHAVFDWHDGNWVQSAVEQVKPGDVIYGNVTWDAASSTYTQAVGKRGGKPIATKVSKADEHGEVFSDVYVVVEHQPNSCAEYPSNNNVTFTDIAIQWASGAPLTLNSWSVAAFKPACGSTAQMLSANAVQLLWKSA